MLPGVPCDGLFHSDELAFTITVTNLQWSSSSKQTLKANLKYDRISRGKLQNHKKTIKQTMKFQKTTSFNTTQAHYDESQNKQKNVSTQMSSTRIGN